VAPLPGLHAESLEDAEAQLALLCRLLPGATVSPSVALLEVNTAVLRDTLMMSVHLCARSSGYY
jgi:hypothetical protein